jgi:Arc/MetJ-type ribon-helix-helix transcriptional regulator
MVRKLAISLESQIVSDLDRLVREGKYPNRSRAVQAAVTLLTEKEERTRLARELAKLDTKAEQSMAEEGLGDASWPRF